MEHKHGVTPQSFGALLEVLMAFGAVLAML
jgi:hypothetical protein